MRVTTGGAMSRARTALLMPPSLMTSTNTFIALI